MTTPNDPHNWSPTPVLQKLGDSGTAGFALQNATPTFLTWTPPNDGQQHYVSIAAELNVTSLQTGGAVVFNVFGPDGANHQRTIFAGGLAAGFNFSAQNFVIAPGQPFSVAQSSAQTAGAAQLYVQFWGA